MMYFQKNDLNDPEEVASIPLRWVGPVSIVSHELTGLIPIPLATLETPLWPSTHRGARVATQSGGIQATIVDERMSRSILLEAQSARETYAAYQDILARQDEWANCVRESSRFARLIEINAELIGNLLYLRLEFLTGDAAGHNMVTLASDRLMSLILQQYPSLKYSSISGNYCTDKKVSAVNGILGRGKHVIAEVTIPRKLCVRYLKVTPHDLVQLHIKKNLLGSVIAGSLRSANAHVANMLLGFYLATGQDAANIIEGSQAIVHAEVRQTADADQESLYFSLTLPNLIVGSVGSGKTHAYVRRVLEKLDCVSEREPGKNARRLAVIAAAASLCGELSLLAAQTNPGELMASHLRLERMVDKED